MLAVRSLRLSKHFCNVFRLLLILILGVNILGCSPVSLALTARGNSFPVSMSEGFYNTHGGLMLKEQYDVIQRFNLSFSETKWSDSFGSKKSSIDISQDLDGLLKKYEGDAIVNLQISGGPNPDIAPLGAFMGSLTFGLFAPKQLVVIVEGDIVRIKRLAVPTQ